MRLSAEEEAIVKTVHDFVDKQVKPVVQDLEHANAYPEDLIETMKEMGIYGLAIPEPYGFGRVSMPCYVQVDRGTRARLDEPGRRDGRPHGGGQAAARSSAPRSRRRSTCRGWRPASSGPRWR